MRKIICDRCGNEISDVVCVGTKDIYPRYHIVEMKSISNINPLDGNLIDLCPSCEKELSKWLSGFADKLKR